MAGARTDHWYDETGLTLETGASTATYLRDQGGTLLSTNTGGATYNYGRDRLGSVTALVTTSGALANTYTYTPYGDTQARTGTVSNPFRFTGTYFDGTGYYLMGARYYHQPTGRFTQLDPLPSQMLSVNRYAYVDCNPVNATDPTGLATACTNNTLLAIGTGYAFAQTTWGWLSAGMAFAFASGPFLPVLVGTVGFVIMAGAFGAAMDQAQSACGYQFNQPMVV